MMLEAKFIADNHPTPTVILPFSLYKRGSKRGDKKGFKKGIKVTYIDCLRRTLD